MLLLQPPLTKPFIGGMPLRKSFPRLIIIGLLLHLSMPIADSAQLFPRLLVLLELLRKTMQEHTVTAFSLNVGCGSHRALKPATQANTILGFIPMAPVLVWIWSLSLMTLLRPMFAHGLTPQSIYRSTGLIIFVCAPTSNFGLFSHKGADAPGHTLTSLSLIHICLGTWTSTHMQLVCKS